MKLYFKPKVTVICLLLMAGMIRLSFWQWDRHVQKLAYIEQMDARLHEPVVALTSLIPTNDPLSSTTWNSVTRRRVEVSGEYDFAHEMVLRNRRLDGAAGVYALTPLKIDGTNNYILVNRGFIPLTRSEPDSRKEFQRPSHQHFIGLLKETSEPKFLAPQDPPTGPGLPWVDAWLRVDTARIAQQLPYPIFPVHLEIMNTQDLDAAQQQIVHTEKGKEELLFLGARDQAPARPDFRPELTYPVAVFDTVLPPGRHLGYVYEWAFMALMTGIVCIILQLKPGRAQAKP